MLTGRRYYKGEHDVLNKKRTTIVENGKLMELENLPNYKIVDNQIDDLVDQKSIICLVNRLKLKQKMTASLIYLIVIPTHTIKCVQ